MGSIKQSGVDPREERSPPPLPQTAAGEKIDTPKRSKVCYISPRMHQNSPFQLKNRNIFLGGGTTPSPHPTPLAPRSSRLRRSTRSRRLHSPPSHTFWIRPWPQWGWNPSSPGNSSTAAEHPVKCNSATRLIILSRRAYTQCMRPTVGCVAQW